MNFSLYIAKRYLFSKKSHNAINVISMISVCGISVATMAMICALSVFNGFSAIVATTFSAIDPQIQITATKGKVFDPNIAVIQQIKQLPEIELIAESIEENALLKFGDKQEPVIVRGVSPEFRKLANIDSLIIDGTYLLKEGETSFSIIGVGLAMKLAIRAGFIDALEVIAPKRDVKVNLANPSAAFSTEYTFLQAVFALNQPKYDEHLILIEIDQARQLFRYETEVTSLDLKVKEGQNIESVVAQIRKMIGSEYLVKDRFEQQAESFRMVNIEKWVTFLLLAFILVIAVFNIIGSLSMLIIDKKEDVKILRNMGANNNQIARIFMFEGWLITFLGAIAGLLIGLTLCLMQQEFGVLKLGSTPGAFAIDAYPVGIEAFDVICTLITVLTIGLVAVIYPVQNFKKRLKNNEL